MKLHLVSAKKHQSMAEQLAEQSFLSQNRVKFSFFGARAKL